MSDKRKPVVLNRKDVDQFLAQVARTPVRKSGSDTGRLLFAMDATASREPTWDHACHLQGQMFEASADVGSLSVQLCHYGGFNQFCASRWCHSAQDLLIEMSAVRCLGGHTQIARVLDHAMTENRKQRLRAVVFVGDAIEENPDTLCHKAGQLGVMNLPLFMFQEDHDPGVRSAFQQMAHLSGGAYAPFNLSSASELKELLAAVAVYAAGGRAALEHFEKRKSAVALLTSQLRN